jgi:diacylglycerol kinase
MKKFLKGFHFAFEGLVHAFKTQVNMRFHLFAAFLVVIFAIYFKITLQEWLWVLLSIALVFSAELLNTALEALTDLASPEIHPLAKIAKDSAAAAVLTLAIFAILVGLIVFLPYLLEFIS